MPSPSTHRIQNLELLLGLKDVDLEHVVQGQVAETLPGEGQGTCGLLHLVGPVPRGLGIPHQGQLHVLPDFVKLLLGFLELPHVLFDEVVELLAHRPLGLVKQDHVVADHLLEAVSEPLQTFRDDGVPLALLGQVADATHEELIGCDIGFAGLDHAAAQLNQLQMGWSG